MKRLLHFAMAFALPSMLSACSGSDETALPQTADTQGATTIRVALGSDFEVEASGLVTVTGEVVSTNASSIAVDWQQNTGDQVAWTQTSDNQIEFIAPEVESEQTLGFLFTATSNGVSDSDDINIRIRPKNKAPVVNVGNDLNVISGEFVSIVSSAYDEDGEIETFSWQQTAGPLVALSAANLGSLAFTSPAVESATTLRFALSVTDNKGRASEDTVEVLVVPDDIKVTLHETPDALSQLSYARLVFSAASGNQFECKLDNGTFQECESPFVAHTLSKGEHAIAIRAVSPHGTFGAPVYYAWQEASMFGDAIASNTHPDVVKTNVMPSAVDEQSWRGIFRINCDFAHSSYHDPIVYPDQSNAAHLHRFYGNTLVDEKTTTVSLVSSGESSCQGNTLNRSSYWVPALLAPAFDVVTKQRLYDEHGEPAWKPVPAVVGNDDEAHEIFYYSAGIDDLQAIQSIPVGLKMIAGSHMGKPGMEQETNIVRWHCQSWESSDAHNPRWSTSIPHCEAPDRVRMDIFFPSCWNGVDLDSSDHKSHMAYPSSEDGRGETRCPETHPVPILRVSFHYAFGVKPEVYHPELKSSQGWRLASDLYEVSETQPGGMSLHGDWFNAWHPEALQAVLENCIQGRLDCHDGNLANGWRLNGTREGTHDEPAIINQGLGYGRTITVGKN
ncbi:Putative periplasmic or exported protein [Pseudoalteromonas luteoviolacea B = ATCC 29581]|nr:Putative periplasmic or exported protein [Pseudoalteromonas luteoviolacea B = ATCC 29581]